MTIKNDKNYKYVGKLLTYEAYYVKKTFNLNNSFLVKTVSKFKKIFPHLSNYLINFSWYYHYILLVTNLSSY